MGSLTCAAWGIWSDILLAEQGGAWLEHQQHKNVVYVRLHGAHGYWHWYMQTAVTVTHTSGAAGQVVQSLTHIPVLVPSNPERKHCSAHSLARRPNGSSQRVGHKWSQCQRTISGGTDQHGRSHKQHTKTVWQSNWAVLTHPKHVKCNGTLRWHLLTHLFGWYCIMKSMTL